MGPSFQSRREKGVSRICVVDVCCPNECRQSPGRVIGKELANVGPECFAVSGTRSSRKPKIVIDQKGGGARKIQGKYSCYYKLWVIQPIIGCFYLTRRLLLLGNFHLQRSRTVPPRTRAAARRAAGQCHPLQGAASCLQTRSSCRFQS